MEIFSEEVRKQIFDDLEEITFERKDEIKKEKK
jgi:hypothetical protein